MNNKNIEFDKEIKTVLITGITGSGGSYLADYIVENISNVRVHGIARWHSTSSNNNLEKVKHKAIVHECDLCDLSSLLRTLEVVKPDAIFHLASYANVRASFTVPLSVLNNNVNGTANLFEALRILNLDTLVQHCSTSEVYGRVDPKNVPIKEDCPINAVNPYSVSKVTQDLLGQSYFLSYGMKIIRTRMFAYINPRRKDLFATSFAYQVAKIEAGLQEKLLHGNLDSTRTLIDVRDAMSSYWAALTKGKVGETYNIGGRKVIKVGEFLDVLKARAKTNILSEEAPNLLRPADITMQIPDTSKFKQTTNWEPQYSFEESVDFLLEHCRKQVAKEKK